MGESPGQIAGDEDETQGMTSNTRPLFALKTLRKYRPILPCLGILHPGGTVLRMRNSRTCRYVISKPEDAREDWVPKAVPQS